jgi:hypothetical protein
MRSFVIGIKFCSVAMNVFSKMNANFYSSGQLIVLLVKKEK